ncbi:MAG: diguanylate cyclase [Clostridia bacterium]|nr:diguanylate cyclase [Clostridia bacterium]
MDNRLQAHFRKQLINMHALALIAASFLEIIGYFLLVFDGREEASLQSRYLWCSVVLPVTLNVAIHCVMRFVLKKQRITKRIKNATAIGAALAMAFLVTVVHKEQALAGCTFIFPIMLSALFNDRKLLNVSLIASLLILTGTYFVFAATGEELLSTWYNYLCLVGFAVVSYGSGTVIIRYSGYSVAAIQKHTEKYNKLRADLLRDPMTGLFNHNTFISRLDRTVKRAAASAKPLCLVMLDIDNFKQINDTYGHDCGDEVLLFLANAIGERCQKGDTPSRYGGEEFAIIFENKGVDEAFDIISDLLEHFSRHRFSFTDTPITFSAGISEYDEGLTDEDFFELTDQALYQAKKQGKNQIFVCK